jgi:nucleotide-binding universal stress UspA family protein
MTSLLALGTAAEERTASQGAELARSYFRTWQVTAWVLAGSLRTAVLDAATQWRADLVVLGRPGTPAAADAATRSLVADAPVPVRIGLPMPARRGAARIRGAHDAPRILVGIDGSAGATMAVCAAARRCWQRGVEARVVRVIDPSARDHPEASAVPGWSDAERYAVRRSLELAAEELDSAGLSVTSSLLWGDPVKVLLAEATRFGAECVYVGARGVGATARLGHVARALIDQAPCSVEVER